MHANIYGIVLARGFSLKILTPQSSETYWLMVPFTFYIIVFFKKNKTNPSHEPSLSPAGCFSPKGHLEETGPRILIKRPVPSASVGTVSTYARLVHSYN
jgi:hypothetical protein